MRKVQELRTMSDDQLQRELNEIEISLRRLRGYNRAQKGTVKNKRENPAFMFSLRKRKARILTILRERELRKNKKN